MATHPWWRPYAEVSPDELARGRVTPAGPGGRRGPVRVVEHDPEWTSQFAFVRGLLESALGERALAIRHVGSTAVQGLWAKPVLDVDLLVADPAREEQWLPLLESVGLALVVREPEWEQHRCLVLRTPRSNVHVFGPEAIEPLRHLAFREWLATHPKDRSLYAALKRELAARGFDDVTDYNNHKAALVYDIHERIFLADPDHEHVPQPREQPREQPRDPAGQQPGSDGT